MNIDVAGDVGDLRHIVPVNSISFLPQHQDILKPTNLIELIQIFEL
jgi:hypothetical protein